MTDPELHSLSRVSNYPYIYILYSTLRYELWKLEAPHALDTSLNTSLNPALDPLPWYSLLNPCRRSQLFILFRVA